MKGKKVYNIGFFGDDVWAHKALYYILEDRSINIDFICGRFLTKDKKLKKIAKKNKIKFFKLKNVNDIKFINLIKKKKIDLFVSMSYDQIFKKKTIKAFSNKIINCHAGKLPFYRGRNILNWALINGEKSFGITTHFINEKIDSGKIIIQKTFKIHKTDDYKSLLIKSHIECAKIIYKTIKKIQNNNYKAITQKKISKKISYYRKRVKGDEIIDLKQESHHIENFVKALVAPGPFARINLKNNQIYVKKVSTLNKKIKIHVNKNDDLTIKNKKIYIPTIDKKILCIEKWQFKKKIKKNLKLKIA
jgi:methionyl-tRNA formyltransferase